MIAYRWTFYVKPGRRQEAVALLKDFAAQEEGTVRIYSSKLGPHGAVCVELVYESLAAFEKDENEWAATPAAEKFRKAITELTVSGGSDEVWTLE